MWIKTSTTKANSKDGGGRDSTGKTSSFDSKSYSTGSSDLSTGSSVDTNGRRSRSVLIGRTVFVVFLLVVAAVLSILAYYFLNESEQQLVEEQYYSMTARALEVTQSLAKNKLQHGTMVMSRMAAHAYPDADSWPFVFIEGYWDIVAQVIPTSCYTGIHLAPLVLPEQAAEFETFAYAKFAETFGANTTMGAYSHFGKGIWGKSRIQF